MSHMSMVAGPPASQTMMTELALRFGRWPAASVARASPRSEHAGRLRPEQPGRADLQEVAAVEAFAIACMAVIDGACPEVAPRVGLRSSLTGTFWS